MAVYQPKTVQGTDTFESAPDATTDALRAELAREQERLRKLWDAFKTQEDELAQLRLATPTSTLSAADGRGSDSLRREVELLTGDLRRAAEGQKRLEDENQVLRENAKAHAEVARRLTNVEGELAEERERLAKLYAVYEEVETERKKLESRLKEWDAWFHGAAPHIEELARSIHGAPHHHH
jgi:chromosome segregation ATPase